MCAGLLPPPRLRASAWPAASGALLLPRGQPAPPWPRQPRPPGAGFCPTVHALPARVVLAGLRVQPLWEERGDR